MLDDRFPRVTAVRRTVHLSARRAEIDSTRVKPIHRHRVAQHVDVAVALWQAFGERLPLVTAGLAPVNTQSAVKREMLGIACDRDDVNGFRIVRIHVYD